MTSVTRGEEKITLLALLTLLWNPLFKNFFIKWISFRQARMFVLIPIKFALHSGQNQIQKQKMIYKR